MKRSHINSLYPRHGLCSHVRTCLSLAILAVLVLADQDCLAQISIPATPLMRPGAATAPDKSQAVRALSAIELARIAADSNLPEVSFAAVRRAVGRGPVVASVNLGGLLGSAPTSRTTFSSSRSQPTESELFQTQLASKLSVVDQLWRDKQFEPAQCYAVWLSLVFPPDRPNEAFLLTTTSPRNDNSFGSFQLEGNQYAVPPLCGGQLLVDWAIAAKKVDELKTLLDTKSKNPGCADVAMSITLWLALAPSSSNDQLLGALKALTPRATAVFGGRDKETMLHAALLALDRTQADAPSANEFFKAILQTLKIGSMSSRDGHSTQFLRRYIQRAIESGNQSQLNEASDVVLSQGNSIRSNNLEYVASIEAAAFRSIASYALQKDKFDIAMHWLKRSMEQNEGAERYGRSPTVLVDLSQDISRNLLKMPAKTRYEAMKEIPWSLPMLGLQMQATMARLPTAPPLFLPAARPLDHLCSREAESVSLLEWLMRDAIACDQSADIEQRIEKLKATGSEDAKLASLVWELAYNRPLDVNAWIEKDATGKSAIKRLVPSSEAPIYLEIALATAAIREPAARKFGIEFLERLEAWCTEQNSSAVSNSDSSVVMRASALLPAIRNRLIEARLAAESPPKTQAALRHWVATGGLNSRTDTNAKISSIWTEMGDGRWGHQASRASSKMYFKYPLTGDFKIQIAILQGKWRSGGAGFAGTIFSVSDSSSSSYASLGTNSGRYGSSKQFDGAIPNEFNAVILDRKADQLTCKFNGKDLFAATIDQSESPFFSMSGLTGYRTSFEKVSISGSPSIPRKVTLSTPGMLGWSSEFLSSAIRPHNVFQNESSDSVYVSSSQSTASGDLPYDWQCVGGTIESIDHELLKSRGKKSLGKPVEAKTLVLGTAIAPPNRAHAESSIAYTRPLCDGETIELEFYHDSKGQADIESPSKGRFSLAPTLGRIAFLLDQPNVALHWIAQTGDDAIFGIEPTNRVIDPQAKQLVPVELKEKEWNALRVSLNSGEVSLSINGQEAYRRTWDAGGHPEFGLFHNPQQFQVRVRNVHLTGNWPEKLPVDLMETQ